MYDQENYLRYYIKLALDHWWLIAAAVFVAGASAFILTSMRDHVYEAQATIAMLRSRTEVELDPRIETLQESASATAREEGLLTLAKSNHVARQVLEDVSELLEPERRGLNSLRDMVEAEITGDLVNITVQHPDPDVAATIANSWAQRYEEYVNSVYSSSAAIPGSSTDAQVATAKQDYEAAQQRFEAFIAEDQMLTLEREIAVREALLDGYQQTLIDMRVKPITTDQAILDSYYTELQQIDGWLADARSLLEQVQSDTDSTASNMGNAVAFVLLQGKISSSERPGIVQPQPRDPETASGGSIYVGGNTNPMSLQVDVGNALVDGVSPDDVAALIQTLESRREATVERISNLQATINGGDASASSPIADYSQLEGQLAVIENEINGLQSELEAHTALRQELEQARDRSWEAYQVLLGRQVEADITSGSPGAEVRIADLAVVPTEPVGKGVIRNSVLAATVAFMFAIGVILLLDWWTWDQPAVGEQESAMQPTRQDEQDDLGVERATGQSPGSRQLSNPTT